MKIYKTSKQNVLLGHEEFIKTHTRKEIMAKFEIDYNTVNNFCRKTGVKPIRERIHTIECPDGFIEYAKNHTVSQVGKHFNIYYPTVLRLCKLHDVKCLSVIGKVKPFDSTENRNMKRSGFAQDMIRELSKTFTYASIGRVFGYSKERIRQICLESEE